MVFQSINDYYNYLEQDASVRFSIEATSALIMLRDSSFNIKEKDDCSFELLITEVSFFNGNICGRVKHQNSDQFFDVKLLDHNLEYLKARAEAVVNPKYKAKYNHILWESSVKHILYAKIAVDNYFFNLNQLIYPLSDNLSNNIFESTFKNLFLLTKKINYRHEEVIRFFESFLESTNINGMKKCSLMQFIVEKGKLNKSELETLFNYALNAYNNVSYPELLEYYLNLLINISQRLNIPQKPYYINLGNHFIATANWEIDAFIQYHYYQKAMAAFQKADDKSNIEITSNLIERTKNKLDFKSHKFEYENDLLQAHWDQLRNFISSLIHHGTSEQIFDTLASDIGILPPAESLNEEIKSSLMELITVTNFDINRNVTSSKKAGFNTYHLFLTNFTMRSISLIFKQGFLIGKITFDSLIDYLKTQTWFGKDDTDINEISRGFNWLELLSPGIKSFFDQSKVDIEDKTNSSTGYILAVDSIVLKFEGIIRDFSKKLGAQTIEKKEHNTSERISFDKLLENEKLLQIIPKDDIAFFKYLFTENGLNLRNNIAHCFYKETQYSAGLMFLLITALLRLGNYSFENSIKNNP